MIEVRRRALREARAVATPGGFAVAVDGKPIRLADGAVLTVATLRLAEAIAREWTSGTPAEAIRPQDIPLTRIAGTAQVRIAPDPRPMIAALGAFGTTDLICYRATGPAALVRRENALWQPWIEWARSELGAALNVTSGVMPVAQGAEPLAALERALAVSDVPALAALGSIVPALGSLVLGLAIVRNRISAAEAAEAAMAEEIFQAECWGEDPIAAARRADLVAEVAVAAEFVLLARA